MNCLIQALCLEGSNDGCTGQVFGLAGIVNHPTDRCFPAPSSQCINTAFVPAYRCGTALDSHQIP